MRKGGKIAEGGKAAANRDLLEGLKQDLLQVKEILAAPPSRLKS
jgi:hypothetical protein